MKHVFELPYANIDYSSKFDWSKFWDKLFYFSLTLFLCSGPNIFYIIGALLQAIAWGVSTGLSEHFKLEEQYIADEINRARAINCFRNYSDLYVIFK